MNSPEQPPAAEGERPLHYVLRLYVAGACESSRAALLRVNELCATELRDRCELHVIDVLRQPELARDADVFATPTLVKESPLPTRRFFGNLEDTDAILAGLDLQAGAERRATRGPRKPIRHAGPERSADGNGS